MRLFYPHLLCAAIVTIISGLVVYYFHTQTSLEDYHLFRWTVGGLHILSLCVIAWIAGVRAIEYHRLRDLLTISLSTTSHGTWLEKAMRSANRVKNTIKFWSVDIQRARGCRGRQRVIHAVVSDLLNVSWSRAKELRIKNQITGRFKSSWRDYFLPEW